MTQLESSKHLSRQVEPTVLLGDKVDQNNVIETLPESAGLSSSENYPQDELEFDFPVIDFLYVPDSKTKPAPKIIKPTLPDSITSRAKLTSGVSKSSTRNNLEIGTKLAASATATISPNSPSATEESLSEVEDQLLDELKASEAEISPELFQRMQKEVWNLEVQYRHQEPESSWHRSSLQRQNVNRDSFQKLFNDNYHHNSLVVEHHSSASQDRLKLSLPEILERQRQHQQQLAIAKQREAEAEARRQAELESKQQQERELVDELVSTTVEPTTTEVVSSEVTIDSSANLSKNSRGHSPKAQDSKDEFEEGHNDESTVQSFEDNSSTSANISNHQQLESLKAINVEYDNLEVGNVEVGNAEEAVELVSLDANKAPMDRVTDDLAVKDTLKEVSELKETNNRKEIRGVAVQELEVIKELENLKINRGAENLFNSEELGANFNNSKNSRNSDNPNNIIAKADSNIEVINLKKLRTIELSQVQADTWGRAEEIILPSTRNMQNHSKICQDHDSVHAQATASVYNQEQVKIPYVDFAGNEREVLRSKAYPDFTYDVEDLLKDAPVILEAKDLNKTFEVRTGLFKKEHIKAVQHVSFELRKGETLSIVGESGSGKTTVAKMIAGLTCPTSGEIILDGEVLRDKCNISNARRRKEIQVVFQNPHSSLNPRKTIFKTLEEPLILNTDLNAEERRKLIEEMIQLVGLKIEHLQRLPHMFSGGQKQRIAIARSLILRPSIVIADEAVSALDVSVQAQILNLMLDLQKRYNLSYLFISHDLSVVKMISHKIMVMYHGEVVEFGTVDQIFNNPQHPYTKKLLEAIPKLPACAEKRIRDYKL